MDTLLLILIALAGAGAVLAPVLAGRRAGHGHTPVPVLDDDALEREIARYREAVRADTVCRNCHFANPPESRFCADCGRRLPEA